MVEPERCHQRMGRAGYGILGNPQAWGKKPQLVIGRLAEHGWA